jgi:SH3-like domain-containing protein
MPVSSLVSMRRGWRVISLLLAIGLVTAADSSAIAASAGKSGGGAGASGLPVPRFVSLKAGRVNVRIGPGEDYKIAWVFTRPGLPIEVIQEFDNWRRIRDSDGTVGWVFQSLLAGKRTAVVAPWASDDPRPIRASASPDATVEAYLQPGVMAEIERCSEGWCRLSGANFDGWITQEQLWGVYPGEEID